MADLATQLVQLRSWMGTITLTGRLAKSHTLQGHDLWEAVGDGEREAPQVVGDAPWKWKIKIGKALFILKTTVEENLLDHIRDIDNLRGAWDIFAAIFSRTKDAQFQHLENQLMNIKQDMTISQYFMKITSLCHEIAQLDPNLSIPEVRMRWIIIHGLRPDTTGTLLAYIVSKHNQLS